MIPGLVQEADDPLNTFKKELTPLYEGERSSPSNIPPALGELEEQYVELLGDKAEFWLLLATGYRLAAPYPVYGHPSGSYYGHAESCLDLDKPVYFSLRHAYDLYLAEQLETRPLRTLAIMSEHETNNYRLAAERLRFSMERRVTPRHAMS